MRQLPERFKLVGRELQAIRNLGGHAQPARVGIAGVRELGTIDLDLDCLSRSDRTILCLDDFSINAFDCEPAHSYLNSRETPTATGTLLH